MTEQDKLDKLWNKLMRPERLAEAVSHAYDYVMEHDELSPAKSQALSLLDESQHQLEALFLPKDKLAVVGRYENLNPPCSICGRPQWTADERVAESLRCKNPACQLALSIAETRIYQTRQLLAGERDPWDVRQQTLLMERAEEAGIMPPASESRYMFTSQFPVARRGGK
jgi:hypothetical protein